MQGFLTKLRVAISRFMLGRHGADQLSVTLIYLAVALNLLAMIPYLGGLSLIALAALIFAVYRTLSKNNQKRYAENAWFLKKFGGVPAKIRRAALSAKQALIRLKNSRKYLYFDCPDCHAKLRLPRGVGDVNVTCGRCGKSVRKTA